MQVLITIFGFILFIGLVLVHEWGHFIAARRNGVDVEEFGLGFPPRAYGKKIKSGTLLSINWLPLGGFVKLKGEHDSDNRKGSFGAASLAAKTKIMLAGVGMNLLVAILILTFLYLTGMPKLVTKDQFNQDQFAQNASVSKQEVLAIYIEKNSPASRAGLVSLDKIKSISNGQDTVDVKAPGDLKKATDKFEGQDIQLTYIHNSNQATGHTKLRSTQQIKSDIYNQAGIDKAAKITAFTNAKDSSDNIKIKSDDDLLRAAQAFSGEKIIISFATNGKTSTKPAVISGEGYLGVQPYSLQFVRSGWSAPINAIGFTGQLIKLTAQGLWHAVSGLGSLIAGAVTNNHQARVNGQDAATSQVGGPVAIFKILSGSSSLGVNYLLAIIALISLTLAFMNILPIPALDGGRLMVLLLSRGLLKRPLSRTMEERIHGAGMAVLLLLITLITIVDVKRFF